MSLLKLLNSYSVKQLYVIIRMHNLHEHIKLRQSKLKLIEGLMTHYDILNETTIKSKLNELILPVSAAIKVDVKPEITRIYTTTIKPTKRSVIEPIIEPVIEHINEEDRIKFINRLNEINKLKKSSELARKDVYNRLDKKVKKEQQKAQEENDVKDSNIISEKLKQLILITPAKYIIDGLAKMNIKMRYKSGQQINKASIITTLLQYVNDKTDKIEIMKQMINNISANQAEAKAQTIISRERYHKEDEINKAYHKAHKLIPIEDLTDAIKRFVRGERKDDENLIYSLKYTYPNYTPEMFDEYRKIYEYLGSNLQEMKIKNSTRKVLQEDLNKYNKVHSTNF